MKKKVIALALGCAMTLGCAIGGTLAWLTDSTDEVKNVFTDSDIKVELKETTQDYKMVPGWTIEKDPVVTIKRDSEDCWVFIKVEKSPKLDEYIEYTIDTNNWKQLKDDQGKVVDGVYVGTVPCKDIKADRSIKILLNNQVKVKESVTKEMMNALRADNYPTLTFTAYASQLMKDNNTEFEPYEAWVNISDANANNIPDATETATT